MTSAINAIVYHHITCNRFTVLLSAMAIDIYEYYGKRNTMIFHTPKTNAPLCWELDE
jgi:hypothetical protein